MLHFCIVTYNSLYSYSTNNNLKTINMFISLEEPLGRIKWDNEKTPNYSCCPE